MLCILTAIFAWAIMVFASTNLIGFVVRGLLWTPPQLDESDPGLTDRVKKVLERESRRMIFANMITTLLSITLASSYIYSLFYFWNLGLALAGVVLMASRLPDLIWQLRTGVAWQPLGMTGTDRAGRKVTRFDLPKGVIYRASSLLFWGTLPLIWYSLCKWSP